jgi:lysosomal acid lipase/cholesteryl ester hydrolase
MGFNSAFKGLSQHQTHNTHIRHADLLQPQLIAKYGYPVETHTVLTADGYFLTLHRIPYGRHNVTQPGHPVILQHGVLGCSADWVILGPDKALSMCCIE